MSLRQFSLGNLVNRTKVFAKCTPRKSAPTRERPPFAPVYARLAGGRSCETRAGEMPKQNPRKQEQGREPPARLLQRSTDHTAPSPARADVKMLQSPQQVVPARSPSNRTPAAPQPSPCNPFRIPTNPPWHPLRPNRVQAPLARPFPSATPSVPCPANANRASTGTRALPSP